MAPSRVQLTPAAALAKRSMSPGPSPRSIATMNAAAEDVAGAGRVHGLDLKRRLADAADRRRARPRRAGRASRTSIPRAADAALRSAASRSASPVSAAARARQRSGSSPRRRAPRCGRCHSIDVARHRHAGVAGRSAPRGLPRPDRRRPRAAPGRRWHLGRHLARPQRQPLVAIPQDDALAGLLVDHDHRELVGDVADDGVASCRRRAARARRGGGGRCRRCRSRRCTSAQPHRAQAQSAVAICPPHESE